MSANSKPISISMVIPNWNSGPVLERCIRSIISQSYPNLQLIMADAGSTDVSREVIERYRKYFDVVISEKDAGQADGLNKGFRCAEGEIRGWLCADDELLPGALQHVDHQFREHRDIDVVIGRCERVFANGERYVTPVDRDAWKNIVLRNTIEQPSTFWRADLHKQVGELDNSWYLSFDWVLWIWFRNAGAKYVTTEEVLSRYYFSEDNKCNNAGNLFAQETYRLLKQYGPKNGRIAEAYKFLYYNFDLKGCMDRPPRAPAWRLYWFYLCMFYFRSRYGNWLMNQYNWHFASQQERGIKWW